MNFLTSPLMSAALVVVLVVNVSIAQQSADPTVILYNSQPVEVELSESGQILTFYGILANYMEEYETVAPIVALTPEPVVSMDSYFTDSSKNADYDVVSNERLFLDFASGYATLSDHNIDLLNEVAATLRKGAFDKVIITAYRAESDREQLLQNRLQSALQYLSIKGFDNSHIKTEILQGQALKDQLSITYVQ